MRERRRAFKEEREQFQMVIEGGIRLRRVPQVPFFWYLGLCVLRFFFELKNKKGRMEHPAFGSFASSIGCGGQI